MIFLEETSYFHTDTRIYIYILVLCFEFFEVDLMSYGLLKIQGFPRIVSRIVSKVTMPLSTTHVQFLIFL